ncbi:hypothetical protein ACJ72_05662 [Emergomyces africanus]|uniref:BTB domain-containing protein n=1 Tax=Emergomyces africanus TaxID=1955775 RepID=A0A1B7NTD8_9EURO|nr:hypothetical protein ACJ72_05662 [Emergomyces africanus]
MSIRTPSPDWMERLLSSKQYSDCTIACEGENFYVHKAVVCTQSPVLAAAMDGQFREARTDIMHLYGFDVATVKRMIDYLYTGQFNGDVENEVVDDAPSSTEDPSETNEDILVRIRIKMHTIADYLQISGLRERSIMGILSALEANWSMQRFLRALEAMLMVTRDASLYGAIASVAADHITELLDSEVFLHLDMPNEMTLGIARELAKGQGRPRRYPCRCCARCKFRK